MSGAQQKIRSTVDEDIENKFLFPTDVSTKENSALYMKRLIGVTVSSIAYLRNVFGDDSFKPKKWGEYNLKILNCRNKESLKLVRHLTGVYDAYDKRYLREMILGICADRKNTDDVVEAYSFKFDYAEDGETAMTFEGKTRSATFKSAHLRHQTNDDVNDSMQRLLRHYMFFVESLNKVPPGSFFTMKLLYYDERTPIDYEPPGFVPSETYDFSFGGKNPLPVVFGLVETNHHSVKTSVRTVLSKTSKPLEVSTERKVVEKPKEKCIQEKVDKGLDVLESDNSRPKGKNFDQSQNEKMEETESNSKKRKAWVCYSKTFDENKSENIDGENENLKMKKVASNKISDAVSYLNKVSRLHDY